MFLFKWTECLDTAREREIERMCFETVIVVFVCVLLVALLCQCQRECVLVKVTLKHYVRTFAGVSESGSAWGELDLCNAKFLFLFTFISIKIMSSRFTAHLIFVIFCIFFLPARTNINSCKNFHDFFVLLLHSYKEGYKDLKFCVINECVFFPVVIHSIKILVFLHTSFFKFKFDLIR